MQQVCEREKVSSNEFFTSWNIESFEIQIHEYQKCPIVICCIAEYRICEW